MMAVYRFADFELHEELNELRLRDREVPLQPRALAVLAYLVRNRTRVVDKDELLETLWPGVIVTDGSLQRAVSLARAALRGGGVNDAIRTYAGRGYRFMPELTTRSGGKPGEDNALDQARTLLELGSWSEAAAAFERADNVSPLAPADLEAWGVALQCSGATAAAAEPYERATAIHCTAGDCESAARTVISLARVHFEMGEYAVATGCLQRAATMLADLPLCEQHGHLAWIRGWLASYQGDIQTTLDCAQQTITIARKLSNVDLEAIGLMFQGMALQASGDTRRGLALQDEAGATVLTGGVTPLLGGLVYCGLLGGCCNTGDWPRAGQWSESFTRWCRRNGVRRFSGSCLLHRVEVFIARGELECAVAELRDSENIIKMSSGSVMADAHRFHADIHYLRGDLDQAEADYRAAYELGADPHPGYALVLHRRGHSGAAVRALRRNAGGTNWSDMERKPLYLATAAIIAGESGDPDTAQEIISELEAQPDAWALGTTRGHVLRARGETCLARHHAEDAAGLFREALGVYREMHASLDAAAVRLRLAEALWRLGDPEGGILELDSAERVFTRNEAELFTEDCRRLRVKLQEESPRR